MNKLHKSWVHHPLQADKFASPWESGGTAPLSKNSLLMLAPRLGEPGLTWPLCESCSKYRKGLRLIDHFERQSLVYRSCLGISFWSAVVLRNIIFASMYAVRLLKSAGL